MAPIVQEITLDLDRKNGTRRFIVTKDEDTHRYEIEVRCQYNNGHIGDPPRWENCDHPELNAGLKIPVLDLALALHAKPHGVAIHD